jgi:polar amino acid transport system substrate-binding protein
LTDSLPVSVFAETISHTLEQTPTNDTLAITIKFQDGSLGVIEYFSNGSSQMGKEYCEIFWENQSAILNNFESVSIYYKNRVTEKKFDGKKGHKEEMSATISNFENGESPIDFFGIKFVSLTTFAIIESLQTGRKILLNEFEKMLNEKIEGGE